jgi:hypothetical protein
MIVNQINPMKNNTLSAKGFESTYALLVRSEDRERSIFEGAVYFAVVLSALFSIWQMAKQPIELPLTVVHTTSIAQPADTNQRA